MSNNPMALVHDAKKLITINASRINNTTSPEEKSHGSMHYTITCALKEILGIGLEANLRDFYGSEESIKNKNSVHREIKDSFEDNPTRFIQRHSGFTVVCTAIEVPQSKEFGINPVTLTDASLINGAQTQGILKEISEEYGGALDNTNIRVEIIVESNLDEIRDIAIARNTSNNVSVLSRMGARNHFVKLQEAMDSKIQTNETEDGIPTQTLLQVIKAMMPESLEEAYGKKLKPSAVTSYSSKAGVLTEFRKMMENQKEYEDVLNYYHTFAGYAWKEYLSWAHDPEWISFQKKHKKIGKYIDQSNEIEMQWGIICPTLYGLRNFLVEDTGKWKIKYHDKFDKVEYMKTIIKMFNDPNFGNGDLQTFAKDRAVYSELDKYVLKVNLSR